MLNINTSWEPFPSPGVVYKVSKGWPPRSQPYSALLPVRIPREDALDRLEFLLVSPRSQANMYQYLGEVRDYDIADFQMYLCTDVYNRQFFLIPVDEFCDILLVYVARPFAMFT